MNPRISLALTLACLTATTGCATQPTTQPSAPTTRSSPQPANTINDVLIEQALFGSGTRLVDVTPRVVQLLRAEPAGFAPTADWLHADPVPGKNKSLLIRYRFRGKDRLFLVTGQNRASYNALIATEDNNEKSDHNDPAK